MSQIITQETLAVATGYDRPTDIRKCLERQGITVYTGREGRVWTTLGLIEGRTLAPPVTHEKQPPATVEFV